MRKPKPAMQPFTVTRYENGQVVSVRTLPRKVR